ncbi:MAG: methionyl-tRNA formyltransferase [Gammaproteobacteria bacterium]|nr:methionyl-tRNA formyltransferase [Gammaproteobacteria bacterium]
MTAPDWWQKPRRISLVVDNDSWVLPHVERLADELNGNGDEAVVCRNHEQIGEGAVALYLGCIHITPEEVLARNRRNLVIHASDLPKGRGFSPLTWQILEGVNSIPVCLLEAARDVDAGAVIYRETLEFEGHELLDEMREKLGQLTIEFCNRYLNEPEPPTGEEQSGKPTYYERRRPEDSRLDPGKSIAEQFNLLRTVDNDCYPAFFDHDGHRYVVRIDKQDE